MFKHGCSSRCPNTQRQLFRNFHYTPTHGPLHLPQENSTLLQLQNDFGEIVRSGRGRIGKWIHQFAWLHPGRHRTAGETQRSSQNPCEHTFACFTSTKLIFSIAIRDRQHTHPTKPIVQHLAINGSACQPNSVKKRTKRVVMNSLRGVRAPLIYLSERDS